LGLFLDSWYGGNTIDRKFDDARLIIEPSAQGKKVIDLDK
jgi:predicted SpoU family rRNA methylase